MGFIMWLIVGGVSGWLAGQIMKGGGFGLIGNVVIGLIGGFVGGLLFSLVGLASVGLLGEILTSVVGAIVLIYVVRLLKK